MFQTCILTINHPESKLVNDLKDAWEKVENATYVDETLEALKGLATLLVTATKLHDNEVEILQKKADEMLQTTTKGTDEVMDYILEQYNKQEQTVKSLLEKQALHEGTIIDVSLKELDTYNFTKLVSAVRNIYRRRVPS